MKSIPAFPVNRLQMRRGVSLVEIIVVAAVVAILVATMFSVVGRALAVTRNSTCVSNLRSLHVAHGLWRIENDHQLAPALQHVPKRPTERLFEGGFIQDPDVFQCPQATTDAEGAWVESTTDQNPYRRAFKDKYLSIGANGYAFYRTYVFSGYTITGLTNHAEHEAGFPLFMDATHWQLNKDSWQTPARYNRIDLRHAGKANVVFLDGHVESLDREGVGELHPLGEPGRRYH